MSNIFTHSQLDIRSNPNLFINGCMSVNQRAFNNLGTSNYTLDRWLVFPFDGLTNVNVNQSVDTMPHLGINAETAMRCRPSGAGSYGIYQKIEGDAFFGRTFTVSGKARAQTGAVNFTGIDVYLYNGTTHHKVETEATLVEIGFEGAEFSVTFKTPNADYPKYNKILYMQVELHFASAGSGDDIYHTHFKIEEGSVATPFVADAPATNLAKCQRYYYSNSTRPSNFYPLDYQQGVTRFWSSMWPVTMRSDPSVSVGGLSNLTLTSTAQSTADVCSLQFATASAQAGSASFATFTADAEL